MKRLLSIGLAVLLLAAQMGFSHTTHYCGGEAVVSALSLGGEGLSCGMMEAEMPACPADGTHYGRQKCCDNSIYKLAVENVNLVAKAAFKTFSGMAATLLPALAFGSTVWEIPLHAFRAYSPPLIAYDIPVLLQVFTI